MEDSKIARINELYRKSKAEGLTEREREEQKVLRAEFLESIRNSVRAQMNNVDIIEKDGSVTNVGEKYAAKKKYKN